MREVEFTSDFATKVKGEKLKCDNLLASQLVNEDEVAKYIDETSTTKSEKEVKEVKPKK
jgi:hypothetical protein